MVISRIPSYVERAHLSDADIESLFKALDLDSDGSLSPEEVAHGAVHLFLIGLPDRASAAVAKEFFLRSDIDFDGRISLQEFTSAIRREEVETWKIFEGLSGKTTADGVWDRNVLIAAFQPHFKHRDELEAFVDDAMHLSISSYAADGVPTTFAEFQKWAGIFRLHRLNNVLDDFREIDCGHDAHAAKALAVREVSPWHQFGIASAGLLAGVISRTATAPFELLKVLMATGQLSSFSAVPRQLAKIYSENGLQGLWRGNLANCLKVGPAKAVKFASYESLLQIACANPKRPTGWENFYVSSGVAAFGTTVTYPLDTVKTKLAAGIPPPRILSTFQHIWKVEGVSGIMAGIGPCLISTVPFHGINMAAFMTGKRMYNEYMCRDPLQKPPFSALMGLGIMSVVASEAVAYPLYIIKTSRQAGLGRDSLTIARKIFAERGVLGFYNGVSVAALKSTPAAVLTYTVYENAKAVFKA